MPPKTGGTAPSSFDLNPVFIVPKELYHEKCCQMLAKYFGVMAVVFLVLGLVTPTSWLWILGKVQGVSVLSVLLGVIMFGMGTTLDLKDFLVIFRRPRDIFLGACPGGTTSNVITYMSKGDLAYSVTMTSVSTLLSPVLTPALTFFLIGKEIAFDPVGMFLSILQIVILPVCLGLALKYFLPKAAAVATDYTPAVSSVTICLIIAGVVGASHKAIMANLGVILAVVVLFNVLGYVLGLAVAKLCGLSWKKPSPSPSKSACRIPASPPVLPRSTSLPCRQPSYRARSSPPGSPSPVLSSPGPASTT